MDRATSAVLAVGLAILGVAALAVVVARGSNASAIIQNIGAAFGSALNVAENNGSGNGSSSIQPLQPLQTLQGLSGGNPSSVFNLASGLAVGNPLTGIATNGQALSLANAIGPVPTITDATFGGLTDNDVLNA
jgi:hypothetical protein